MTETLFCEACREQVEHPDPNSRCFAYEFECPNCDRLGTLKNFTPHACDNCGEWAKRAFNDAPAEEQDGYVHLRGEPSDIFCSLSCATDAHDE